MSKVTIMSKIICSLPLSYNNVTTTWFNVHPDEQTVHALKDHLTKYEEFLKRQRGTSEANQFLYTVSTNLKTTEQKRTVHQKMLNT